MTVAGKKKKFIFEISRGPKFTMTVNIDERNGDLRLALRMNKANYVFIGGDVIPKRSSELNPYIESKDINPNNDSVEIVFNCASRNSGGYKAYKITLTDVYNRKGCNAIMEEIPVEANEVIEP